MWQVSGCVFSYVFLCVSFTARPTKTSLLDNRFMVVMACEGAGGGAVVRRTARNLHTRTECVSLTLLSSALCRQGFLSPSLALKLGQCDECAFNCRHRDVFW